MDDESGMEEDERGGIPMSANVGPTITNGNASARPIVVIM
jgi:hypothetical protein